MKIRSTLISTSALMLLGNIATVQAHVTFTDNTATAGSSFIATANISHGCEDNVGEYDTYKVEIELPTGVVARPMPSILGDASVDDPETPTVLTWQKEEADAEDDDILFYQVSFRFTAPNTPFETLTFRTTQYCPGGKTLVWEGVDAPGILVGPSHVLGWNQYTAQTDLDADTIETFFADALIVWSNNQAYSSNPVTADLIDSPLDLIPTGTDYWVKY